ncbi:uncharacterized protein B0J16DRAFT_174071 [Fusarium flagelliforme]|uniref:Uncharacterized protein n=1 Tax=Fusarium flagelliforme TaxID=2675880 RepID=A0A395MLE7_9HYPO|nr:uncharacterized protein B0J16DRAFT_174071 [Fusarium flagelliforme]KAH7179611.1 hypothetical protein B0J16DRAFT_174071 [Fusarium flagelliforme]RFN48766.1 hypothetical protein FIE12Z_6961 [Fusarium flagelliforme]
MPGSIKSIKRKPTAKSAAKRIGRMFKRTNSEDPEMTAAIETGSPKVSSDAPRPSTSSRFSISSRFGSKDDAEATPRGSKDQSRIFASWFDPATPKNEKGPEVMAPPPLVSAYSEPVLNHGKPIAPMMSTESTKHFQAEALPSPVQQRHMRESKTTDTPLERNIGPMNKPENIDQKAQEQPQPEARPLPSPPRPKAVAYEPESPVIPVLPKEKPKQKRIPTPTNEPKVILQPELKPQQEYLAQCKPGPEAKSDIKPAKGEEDLHPLARYTSEPSVSTERAPRPSSTPLKKSTVPRPTVEDEPEPVFKPVEAAKEYQKMKVRNETKTGPKREPNNRPPKPEQKETEPKAEPTTRPKRNTPPPIIPEAIRKHAELRISPKPSPTVSSAPDISPVPAPAPLSVPKAATYTAKHSFTPSVSFQPSRTVYFPGTAPAPKTARAPATARAPTIASTPEVVVSMLTRAAPKTAPVPSIASIPATSWVMSSA